MTVKMLLDLLAKFDAEAEVVVDTDYGYEREARESVVAVEASVGVVILRRELDALVV